MPFVAARLLDETALAVLFDGARATNTFTPEPVRARVVARTRPGGPRTPSARARRLQFAQVTNVR
ncbi:hypothetical protein FE374_15535 [Georgenia yuyongxinii]|uniref:Uncharacterized protein n=1 Tax=Georgenia yuyongxinii TaxID=2589797 RepID=A0A5B8C620_9MICO|nr:hypothetical protein [Georgenia yuyongxinii]QDC25838.1 hypothetical protein FE374_15535 [Georgenia yuyongxinii]